MSVDRHKVSNWWFSLNSIQRSFLLSLLIHLTVAVGVWLGAFPVVEKMMAAVVPELINFEALDEQQRKRQRSVIFLEVPSNMASEDAPEDSKYYSNQNSKAADEQSEKETNQHSKKGEEEHFVGLDGQAGRETDDAEKKNRRSFVFTFCTRRQIR